MTGSNIDNIDNDNNQGEEKPLIEEIEFEGETNKEEENGGEKQGIRYSLNNWVQNCFQHKTVQGGAAISVALLGYAALRMLKR